MMENPLQPNLQYALFCTEFVEASGQVSILGVLDGADVRGTIQRGQPMPQKVFPLKLVLGINAHLGGSLPIDLKTFDAPHWLRFGGIVKELYDVGVLPGVIRPMAVGFKTDEVRRYLSFPEVAES